MAVTLVDAMGVNATTNSSIYILTTVSFTPSAGELIIVKAVIENSQTEFDDPTTTGESITWTKQYSSRITNTCMAVIWSGIVAVGGTGVTVSIVKSSGSPSEWASMAVERWAGAQVAAAPAIGFLLGQSTTTTITTTGTGSYVSYVNGDWNAVAPGTPAYASSAVQENIHDKSTSTYVAYYAYQAAPTAGVQTFGLTSPSSRKDTLIGIEIQAITAAAIVNRNLMTLGVGV